MNRHAVPNATMILPGEPPNAGTKPRFFDFDDGVVRLVKWHPSNHGAKACFNELVATRLGLLIEAPVVRGSVVYVEQGLVPTTFTPQAAGGFHFAVAQMEAENFRPALHAAEIENPDELAAAAVLLAWLQVDDQNPDNQLLHRMDKRLLGTASKERRCYRLVDFGSAFRDGDWQSRHLAQMPDEYILPEHLADQLTVSDVRTATDALKAVPEADIRSCLQDVPDEWAIPNDDVAGATAHLMAAREGVAAMIVKGNPAIGLRP